MLPSTIQAARDFIDLTDPILAAFSAGDECEDCRATVRNIATQLWGDFKDIVNDDPAGKFLTDLAGDNPVQWMPTVALVAMISYYKTPDKISASINKLQSDEDDKTYLLFALSSLVAEGHL